MVKIEKHDKEINRTKEQTYTETELEELQKPKYHYEKNVVVSKIQLETAKNNRDDIARVRFDTSDAEITFKPQKIKKESRGIKGFEVITQLRDVYTIEDLEEEFPVLFKLASDLTEKKQEITLCYVEKNFYNERERELETYFFMMPNHIKTLYYSGFHTDKKMLQEQKEMKERYSKRDL